MDLSLLSQFSPQTLLAKAGIVVIYTIVVASGGFYGGCEFKQNQWDAEKFKQLEDAKNKKQKDEAQGAKQVEQFKQNRKQEEPGKDFVRAGISRGKPLVRVIPAPVAPLSNLKVETKEGTVKDETKPGVYLTANFMQLYDVSVAPRNSELRTRIYQEADAPTIDEGFKKVIAPNNERCNEIYQQLNGLLDRIEQKKALFQPSSKGLF